MAQAQIQMTNSPCLNCPDRRVNANYNCHDKCDKYLSYQKIHAQELERESAAKAKNRIIHGYNLEKRDRLLALKRENKEWKRRG